MSLLENVPQLEKIVTGKKMCHIWKNGSVRKIGHNWKNVEHLVKWVTLKKRVTVRKMCQS